MSSHEPQPPAQPQQAYPQPAGNPSAYAQPAYAQPAPDPGKGIGIAGFVLSLLGPLAIVGLILSIVGVVKSKRAGRTNGLAIAGIVIGALVVVGGIILGFGLWTVWQTCQDLGPGQHYVDGVTFTCS